VSEDVRRLHEILQSGAVGVLAREAGRRRETTAAIRRDLPTDIAEHLVSATLTTAGELVLVMDSPVWAARARYCSAGLPSDRVIVKVLPRGGS
jgi:Dna[CI] antecedent, DciA